MSMPSRLLAGLARAMRPARTPDLGALSHLSTSAPTLDMQTQNYDQEPIVLPSVQIAERWEQNSLTVTGVVISQPMMWQGTKGKPMLNLLIAKRNRPRYQDPSARLPDDIYNFIVSGPLAHAVIAQVRRGQKVIVSANVKMDAEKEVQVQEPGGRTRKERSYVFFANDIKLFDPPMSGRGMQPRDDSRRGQPRNDSQPAAEPSQGLYDQQGSGPAI